MLWVNMYYINKINFIITFFNIILGIIPEFLNIQYRMHPFIAEFPSGAFYNGRIKNGI